MKFDIEYQQLIEELKTFSKHELYERIKQNFLTLPLENQMILENYFKKYPYWGKLDVQNQDFEEIQNKANSFYDHIEDYIWFYNRLADYRSKQLLLAIMKNWYQYDFEILKTTIEPTFDDYFDLDLIKCDEQEVIVDLGAYTGDTIFSYLKNYDNQYKKIYAYEITDTIFEILKETTKEKENVVCHKKAVNDQNGYLFIEKNIADVSANMVSEIGHDKIECVTLDDDIKEPITLLKMDIEGFEQKALLGAKKHIQEEHPKLLISVYHNHEDIWKIPKMIENMCPGYQFYLRNHGGFIFPTEITLLAIYPK